MVNFFLLIPSDTYHLWETNSFLSPSYSFFFPFIPSKMGWIIISLKMRGKKIKITCLGKGISIKSQHLEENCLWWLLDAMCFAFLFLTQVITLIKKDVNKITDLICNQTITCTVLLETTKSDIKQSDKCIEQQTIWNQGLVWVFFRQDLTPSLPRDELSLIIPWTGSPYIS